MTLAPDGLGPDARRQIGVLYRLDETRTGIQILVQTRAKPETARFPDSYGRLDVRELTPLLQTLRVGTAVRYRLAANATKRLGRNAGPETGKVVPLRGADVEEWWASRASRHGLDLRTLTGQPQNDATGDRTGGQRVRHAVTRFDGIAVIRDADALRHAVLDGIGKGKAYGCGLLSLAPLRSAP